MKAGIDIHDYPRRLELSVARMQRSGISEANKRLILRFKDYCIAEGSIGIARTERYIGILEKWAQLLKADFDSLATGHMRTRFINMDCHIGLYASGTFT
jgi:hypothetical protein